MSRLAHNVKLTNYEVGEHRNVIMKLKTQLQIRTSKWSVMLTGTLSVYLSPRSANLDYTVASIGFTFERNLWNYTFILVRALKDWCERTKWNKDRKVYGFINIYTYSLGDKTADMSVVATLSDHVIMSYILFKDIFYK